MDPALRKGLILDETAALVAREGVSAVSMERVGRDAGISKALVYSHFVNRTALLQELLVRGQSRLLARQAEAVRNATSLESLIRLTTQAYLQHVEADGLYIQRLMNEPTVATAFRDRDKKGRQEAMDYLAAEITRTLNIPREIAALATEMSMGMTGVAGELLGRSDAGREQIDELLFCMFGGALAALKAQYSGD